MQERLIIEQFHERFELTKEDIQNYFRFTMKNCPKRAIELFGRFVKIYDSKIEIGINYAVNTAYKSETITEKVLQDLIRKKDTTKVLRQKQ